MPIDLVVNLVEQYAQTEFIAALGVLVVALGALAYRYYSGEKIKFTALPFRLKLRLVYAFRREYFKKGRPRSRVTLGDSVEDVTARLAENGYMPKWPLSYKMKGERENLVRYYYDATRDEPHRQIHVRLFEDDEGRAAVYAHEEPTGLHHPAEHLDTSGHEFPDVSKWVAAAYRTARDDGDGNALDPRLWAADRS